MPPTIDPETRLVSASMRRLGCKPWLEDDAYDCQPRVQAFLDRLGTRTKKRYRQGIKTEGDAYFFRGTLGQLRIPHGAGSHIVGEGGINFDVGKLQLEDLDHSVPRWVFDGTHVADRAFLTVQAVGSRISNIALQGRMAATYTDLAALWATFPKVGLWVPGSEADGILVTGKVNGESLALSGFDTGIRLGGNRAVNGDIVFNGASEQADDLTYSGEVLVSTCQTGLQISSIQSINTEINFLHCQGVGRAVYLQAGGCNTHIGRIYFGEITSNSHQTHIPPRAIIEIGSDVSNPYPYSFNAEQFDLDFLDVDGSVQNTPIILSNGSGAAGHGGDVIYIRGGHIPPAYGYAGSMKSGSGAGPYTWLKPAMLFRGHRHYILEGVSGLQEGMAVLATTAGGSPTVDLINCTFAPKLSSGATGTITGTHDPTLFVDAALSVTAGGQSGSVSAGGSVNHYGTRVWGGAASFGGWHKYHAEEKYGSSGTRTARRQPNWTTD